MPEITLCAAVRAVDERNLAIAESIGSAPAGEGSYLEPGEDATAAVRQLTSGFDVDFDHVSHHSAIAAKQGVAGLAAGLGVEETIASMWLNGLMCGLMLGKLRADDEARRRPADG